MDAALFVRQHTEPAVVPLVPEIRVYTASEVTPVWSELTSIPYWCVPWAGGQALARYVLDHPDTVRDKRIIDFGTGSGLVAIAAKMAGAAHVLAVDIDRFATAAARENAALNGITIDEVRTEDIVGTPRDETILAGDVWYEEAPATRCDAWFRTLATRILTGDPGRVYVPIDLHELARYDVPTTLELESAPKKTTRILTYG